ncbi:MAG: hypothetical protein MJZ57_01870 [Bacteroidales bacterium]|nr:hypothetical protein [Bacteroidales bacterium]
MIGIFLFALAGAAIIGAWGIYQLGFTNNKGGVDENNRYLADYQSQTNVKDSNKVFEENIKNYLNLVALSKIYPTNAHLILDAGRFNERPDGINQMIYAANMYLQEDEKGQKYQKMVKELQDVVAKYSTDSNNANLIPWMNEPAWAALKVAIVKDKAVIEEAARLTGVEPRLIVGCLVGEQIRLFNSKREMYKQYLGPVKVLSVQSQFSLGVNGIKDFTAMQVERNLKDSTSEFYMGKQYEHILDFKTADPASERVNRLVDYHNHLYSYIYTGCILHQTMMQWKRAGFDISNRPDILFTLFNLGFVASKPSDHPQCGGSHITVNDRIYTFGVIGNDFYFSGELAKEFPLQAKSFANE